MPDDAGICLRAHSNALKRISQNTNVDTDRQPK